MTTPNLAMAELSNSQAQKEITHNDALRVLDALVQAGIQDKDLTTPPSHTHGYCWIVAGSATGAWSGKDGKIAQSYNSAWYFLMPKEGWTAWVNDENKYYTYDGSSWSVQSPEVAIAIVAASAKTTPVDADYVPITDSAASNVLKKVTWANLKITLKTYFDTLYGSLSVDWTAPGTIGSATPNTIKGTAIRSTTGLTVDAGGITSVATEAAGGSGILGQADSGAAVSNASRLGYFFLGGAKDASHTMVNSAGLSAYATEAWGSSAAGTKLQLEVTPNGSTTRGVAVTIDHDKTATFNGPLKAWGVETLVNGGTSAGTDTITATPSPAVAALATGQMVVFKAGGTNTSTAPTFSPSSLTAKTIVREGGIAIQPGDMTAGGSYMLRYDGTNWILLNPSTPKMFAGYATRAGDAASGSQAITGVGFKPKYILLHASFVTGYSSFSLCTVVNGVAGLANVQLWTGEINPDNTKIVNLMQSSGNQQSAVLASIDSDGFTLTWTKTGSPASTTMYISYTCIG